MQNRVCFRCKMLKINFGLVEPGKGVGGRAILKTQFIVNAEAYKLWGGGGGFRGLFFLALNLELLS